MGGEDSLIGQLTWNCVNVPSRLYFQYDLESCLVVHNV